MLVFDLRAAAEHAVETVAQVPADDPLFQDLDFVLREPVRVSGRLSAGGPGRYYWHGRVATTVSTDCRRCLAAIAVSVDMEVRSLFGSEEGGDDAGSYVIEPRAVELDLAPVVREELILAVPTYALCRDDCRGLCARCGKDLNAGPCECGPTADARWAPLEALKSQLANDERS